MMIRNKRTEGKIKSHFGMEDYYKFYKKNYNNKISRKIYSDIIFEYNQIISKKIIDENFEYYMPFIDCILCVRKHKQVPKIIDGQLVNKTPIDWKATEDLWNSNDEAKEKKLLVRYNNTKTNKYIFRIFFKKYLKSFTNKKYYKFDTARGFSRMLSERIFDEDKPKYDAYLLY